MSLLHGTTGTEHGLPGDPVPSQTLLDVFGAARLAHPDRIALEAPDAVLTYAGLGDRADAVARRLTATGVGPGDKVGVRIPSGSAELYVAILGVLLSGAAYVPVDADDPDERASTIWDDSGVVAVLGPGARLTMCTEPRSVGRGVEAGDDAWVIFTSGSTGRPKGVAVSHRAATAFVEAEARLLPVGPGDRVLAGLSVGFDASCEEIWLAWRNGAALIPAPRDIVRRGRELGPWLSARRISVVSTVPTLASMWDLADLAGVRLLILGGEACPDELGWRLALDREVWNTYGPTETTVVATAAAVLPGVPITIGWPLEGWQVAVLNAEGHVVPDGDIGELCIGGVGLGRYLDQALDDARFAPLAALGRGRAYRTGDFVRVGPAGLEYIGRRDEQVKIGGRRIELQEVESALASVPGVRQAAVVVRRTPGGDSILVGYAVADVDGRAIRGWLQPRLPEGLVPAIVPLPVLPLTSSGKVDRRALPWPAGGVEEDLTAFGGTEAWLADLWATYLGRRPGRAEDQFFELGGSSVSAAKLASDIRARFPSAAVADIYDHRSLGGLAAHLESLTPEAPCTTPAAQGRRTSRLPQLLGVITLLAVTAPSWVVVVFGYGDVTAQRGLPHLGWPWLLAIWLVSISPPGRIMLVSAARRLLLSDLTPGRYERRSWIGTCVWFVDRLAQTLHVNNYAGTPWAPTVARLMGTPVGKGARLGTIPSPAGLTSIGALATLEADADVGGWWIDGADLVVDRVAVGAGARIGTRSLLMPGASVGDNAEIEPGGVVTGRVPADQRWAGSPARHVGPSGESWPHRAPPEQRRPRTLRAAYGLGLALLSLLPLAAVVVALFIATAAGINVWATGFGGMSLVIGAPLLASAFTVVYALMVAISIRALGHFIAPGWHGTGVTAWASWLSGEIFDGARIALFPLYSSLCTPWWLRLMGLEVGARCEISHAVGLSPLVTFGSTDFVADDVVFSTGRSRHGWLHLSPIHVDDGVFLGNGAIVPGGTEFGPGTLVGVQSSAPPICPPHTSWFGAPALEFPRVPQRGDPRRTVAPSGRLILGRAVNELCRIVLPTSVSAAIALGVFGALVASGQHLGAWAVAVFATPALLAGGAVAVSATVVAKWVLMGRYRAGDHPLWSWFVWRDEILNTCQEVIAGIWLLDVAQGTALMNLYLRLMGTRVGRDVWCDTMNITEFDVVTLGDGCAVNRNACVETHLFHDRIMSIGPTRIGARATLGPSSVVLPETTLGEGSCVGGRSVVLRGEALPERSRWHGAPVVAM